MTKQNNWVSAGDIGRAAYCPRYLVHKRNGSRVDQQAVTARAKGEDGHQALNNMAADKRCYIASHLYGIDDGKTQQLRQWRDAQLSNNAPGKAFIAVYYRLSPHLVSLSRRHSWLDRIIKPVIDHLVSIVTPS